MWIAIGIAAVIGVVFVFSVMKTAGLNQDPVQQELAGLILEMMEGEATPSAQTLFIVSSQRLFMMRMIPPNEHHTRYAHALSLANKLLNAEGQAVARTIIRSMA